MISNRREILLTALFLSFGLLLSACNGGETQDNISPTDTAVVQLDPKPTQDIPVDATTETPVVEPTQEEVVIPTEESPKVELKRNLEATDPGTVNLTSGKPTLVEFFAFW